MRVSWTRQIAALWKSYRIGRKLTVCLVLALFLFGAQIACWSDETNRLFKSWKRLDGVAIMLDVMLLGLTLTLATVAVSRSQRRWLKSLAHFVFLALLAVGVVAVFSR